MEELAATREELVTTKEEQMSTKDELKMLEKEVTIIRDSPYLHMCGSHYEELSYYQTKTVPYSKLLYSSTNTEGGGLDISSGVFTAPCAGSYTVTWSTTLHTSHDH